MTQAKTLTEVLAGLILRRNVPLRAVATAGEIITLDAQITDYGGSSMARGTGEELYQFLEAYDVLLRRCEAIATRFEEASDAQSLITELSTIKRELIELK